MYMYSQLLIIKTEVSNSKINPTHLCLHFKCNLCLYLLMSVPTVLKGNCSKVMKFYHEYMTQEKLEICLIFMA